MDGVREKSIASAAMPEGVKRSSAVLAPGSSEPTQLPEQTDRGHPYLPNHPRRVNAPYAPWVGEPARQGAGRRHPLLRAANGFS
jgi:hypothetical protein